MNEVELCIMESGSMYLNDYRVYGSVKNGTIKTKHKLKVKHIKEALGLNREIAQLQKKCWESTRLLQIAVDLLMDADKKDYAVITSNLYISLEEIKKEII